MRYEMSMNKNWKILQPDKNSVTKICNILKCSPVLATVLVNRNILSHADASRFLSNSLNNLRPPFSIKDMDVAVRRIHSAIINHEKILILGDYDVDGITATVILLEFLQYAGADVSFYIPHRIKEGYSLQTSHISDYALPNRIGLIITVDCGSGSHDAVRLAQDSGTDVIITDHHNIPDEMPPATAVVNPKRQDCTAGFDNLAGVGVAFCLLICLRKYLRDLNFWQDRPEPNLKNFCDLVALGTVADVVPLVGENRMFSKTGLEIIKEGGRPGISALIKACGISNNAVDSGDIAFRLAPRLNAAGRMDHAKKAVKLLTTDDPETAASIARSLNHLNQERQSIEKKMFEEIIDDLKHHPDMLRQSTLVLSSSGWHEGVLGIVASKVVEKYFRPTVLIATKNGIGKGSGRSIQGVDIHAGLVACADDLEFFGGHSMAAGLTIRADNIATFQKNFENTVRTMTTPDNFLQTIIVDYELDFDKISDDLIDELETLEPYGAGNPKPLFISGNIKVVFSKIIGRNHRRMRLKQTSGRGRIINAIQFNIDTDMHKKDYFHQIAFRLQWNRWNDRKTAQIIVEEES